MGVEDQGTEIAALPDQRLQGGGAGVAEQRQRRQPHLPVLAHRLQMPEQLLPPAPAQCRQQGPWIVGQQQLQIGPVRLLAAPVQGGVVPAELPQRQPPAGRLALLPQQAAAPGAQQLGVGRQAVGRGQQQQAMLALRGAGTAQGPGQPRRHRRFEQGHVVEQQGAGRQPLERRQGLAPVVEAEHQLLPGHRLAGRQPQGRQDAIGAIGVVERRTGAGVQLQQLRLRFHRDHLQAEQIARIAQEAPAQ